MNNQKKILISARSDLAPTAKLSFDRSKTDDLSSTYDEREKDVLKATSYLAILFWRKKLCKFK